ncbi:unnamed protein product, partial [Amoebophrya sp. A25]
AESRKTQRDIHSLTGTAYASHSIKENRLRRLGPDFVGWVGNRFCRWIDASGIGVDT